MKIAELFPSTRDIYRPIEKVITYAASQEARLKAEISEYIVTESIEEQFEELLGKMQLAMEQGGQNEVGVWVSGFYGSGKSSFTKYLGLALDDRVAVDGELFLRHLQNRLNRPQTRALLNTLAARYPAAVVLLDLASDMLAGSTMAEVSTVLYYKVLQWAGYSQNLKVAAFERRLKKDGRYNDFTARIQEEVGLPWRDVQNDPLVNESLLPALAHELYPNLFRDSDAFAPDASDIVRFETDRVQEMIDIVREETGKQHIIFVIDEVGQYVGSRPNLILNLDGLAKNLKNIGDGKVWIVGTAQQTLTEDDPAAAFNSPELYKLRDRFPILINLESNDIKEICGKRLLNKSSQGEQVLGELYDRHGQALRHNTRLQGAAQYGSDFDRATFINLYPFLPAHFGLLLNLLSALAKSTGGIGLRSAIKVIQDILVEPTHGQAAAEQLVGWLATTVTLYDALERDIRRSFGSIHHAAGLVMERYPHSPLHHDVAKTVVILQILQNMPVNAKNIASLLQSSVDGPARLPAVEQAITDLTIDTFIPFGEQEGNLRFFSEKLNEIDKERSQMPVRSIETRRIRNEALRAAFTPLPSTRIHQSLTVSAGLKVANGGQVTGLAGERETIQLVVEFADPADYEAVRTRLLEESRQRSSQHTIYLVGRNLPEVDQRVDDIYRCNEIAQIYRNDIDTEVREYCKSLETRAIRQAEEAQRLLKRSLGQGSFLFRGQMTAADTIHTDVLEAARKQMETIAEQVFDRYAEAPVRADTALAEKFLRVGNLRAVSAETDPLGLVQMHNGAPRIHSSHKALVSIRDYLQRHGIPEGKRLSDHFTDAPFGWSPDTLRYAVAALLVAGEISLKVSGRTITVNGQQAIDALRTNNAFRSVGVELREDRPALDVLSRAAQRLTDLCGESVIPLEDEISKAATRYFSRSQLRFGSLAERLDNLGLPGGERVRGLLHQLAGLMQADGSEAPQRLGAEESELYAAVQWASAVDSALAGGLEESVRALQHHCREIGALPPTGAPGKLRKETEESVAQVRERLAATSFYSHAAELRTALTTLQSRSREAVAAMRTEQERSIRAAQAELEKLPAWAQLTYEEQQESLGQLEELLLPAAESIDGLRTLLTQEYVISSRVGELKRQIAETGRERQREEMAAEANAGKEAGAQRYRKSLPLAPAITSVTELDRLIQQLQNLRAELSAYSEIEINLEIIER